LGQYFRKRGQQLAVAFLLAFIAALILGTDLGRAEERTATATGFDISWPQCNSAYPEHPIGFGIVGVTGGKAFTKNACLKKQWQWAKEGSGPAAVYINIHSPREEAIPAGFPPFLCLGNDANCRSYRWGYMSARYAVAYARSQGVTTRDYWLDVETMNYWSPDKKANAEVVAGAIAFLQERDMNVGIYSTPYQWRLIAGDFAPGLPVWTAGASSLEDAQRRCNDRYAFGGGEVALVQWVEVYDRNWVCP
jgi:hypothetical protein